MPFAIRQLTSFDVLGASIESMYWVSWGGSNDSEKPYTIRAEIRQLYGDERDYTNSVDVTVHRQDHIVQPAELEAAETVDEDTDAPTQPDDSECGDADGDGVAVHDKRAIDQAPYDAKRNKHAKIDLTTDA